MTLTKAELADLLFEQLGLNKREAKDMVEHFFEEIRIALERGDAVKLSGFVKSRSVRGVTPKPGKKFRLPPGASSPFTRARN
jgi:integration host factor subunit alpha